MNLCDPKEIKRLMEKYGTAPKKGFGQNFLITPAIPLRIAEESAVGAVEGTCALEIGPGIGCLTSALSDEYERVVSLEIDTKLLPLLEESLADKDNTKIIHGDVMKTDLKALIAEEFGKKPVRVAANLPYYITSPVIMHLLDETKASERPIIESMTVMVQNEVADRLCAEAGSDEYGAITASIALRGSAKKCFVVSAGNFLPAPKVSSAVVRIDLYKEGPIGAFEAFRGKTPEEADGLFEKTKKVLALAFQTRRKTLTNSLGSLFPKEKVARALEALGIRSDVRGEKLSAEQYLNLTNLLLSMN